MEVIAPNWIERLAMYSEMDGVGAVGAKLVWEDGRLQLFAISPRHLEACATRTCQVLVEGEYSGVLRPGEHYIPVRKDLSNLDDVLEHDRVWICRRIDVARHWIATHPYASPA